MLGRFLIFGVFIMDPEEIVFTLRLTEADWDAGVRAWRCAAFDIPSAFIKEAYDPDGQRISASMFKVDKGPARVSWQGPGHPSQIVIIVGIGETLSPTSNEDWWKRFAIIVPIITAIIGAGAAFASKPVPPCSEHTLRLRVDPNDVDGSGLPPAKITLNNQQLGQPIEYKVKSDIVAVVDVNRAYLAVKSLSDAANTSIASLNDAANQIRDFTARVTGNVCSGGSNGVPPQSAGPFNQQGAAIQNKLRGIASDLSTSQANIKK
jgi:hypothetical protein